MSFNQSNATNNYPLTKEEQMLTTCTLVLFAFCCIVPGILLGLLFSTLCCQKQWKALDSSSLSSSSDDDEGEDEFHEISKGLSFIVGAGRLKKPLRRETQTQLV